jgi:uncharacterized protein
MDEPKPTDSRSGSADGDVSQDARTFGTLAHLLGLFTGFLGPLIIWIIKRDEHWFIDDQGKEALNFQIMVNIGYFVSIPLMFLCGLGYLTMIALGGLSLVFSILGAVAANKGETYRYPLNIRMIK